MRVLAIDPGNVESAYVVTTDRLEPNVFGKVPNDDLLAMLPGLVDDYVLDAVAVEMIGHYGTGMPAGSTVFDTCVWIGRFLQVLYDAGVRPLVVKRGPVKLHLCGSARAKDPNVIQALVDRFAPDTPNKGKGSKAAPGFFYGFAADVWQAFALAVYVADGGES